MDAKRRRNFYLENAEGEKLAHAVLYDEGNVQILWRADSGYTAEQYSSLASVLGLMAGVDVIRFESTE